MCDGRVVEEEEEEKQQLHTVVGGTEAPNAADPRKYRRGI